jgi:holo-[acyl-carrier protein] synthase
VDVLRHGVDLVEVARIAAMLDEHGERFLSRCFTSGERAASGVDGERVSRRRGEHLAARFAAKEAVMKALGTGLSSGISWTEIEVVTLATGEPTLLLTGQAAAIASQRGIASWVISLSHTDSMAIASVIGLG